MKSLLVSSAVAGFAAVTYAADAIDKQCQGQLCYSINIPDASKSSGQGAVNLQLTGPTGYSWMGMGTGTAMAGSSMFIIYTSASGNNVTLSTRKGNGHQPPAASSDIQATLLDGSGVVGGQMVANIKCSNCPTAQKDWIWGGVQGSPLNSDSTSAPIKKHTDSYGTFTFDLSKAAGGSSANPFGGPGGSGSGGAGGGSSGAAGGAGGSSSGSSSGSSPGASPKSGSGGSSSGTGSSGASSDRKPPVQSTTGQAPSFSPTLSWLAFPLASYFLLQQF